MTVQTIASVQTVSGKKVIETSRQRVTRFTAQADLTKAFPEHSICIRRAPAGDFKGEIHVEIACPSHLFATDTLKAFNVVYAEVERITFRFRAKWKLFRLECSVADAAKLVDNVTVSDKAAEETAFWLAHPHMIGSDPGFDWNDVAPSCELPVA